jgi:anti-sigma28 factor (negative regulator of flagellin synthesis)
MRVDELMKKIQIVLDQSKKTDELKKGPGKLDGASKGVRAREGDSIKLTSEEVNRVVELMSEVRNDKISEVKQKIMEGFYDREEILKEVSRALIEEDADIILPEGEE